MADVINLYDLEEPAWVESCKAEIDAIFAKYPPGAKSPIMPLLHLAQRERGYVALSDMQAVAELVGTSVAYIDSVCSFYAMYHRHQVGKYVFTVCGNMVCDMLCGGKKTIAHIEQSLGIKNGETTADGLITLEVTPECLAACDLGPVMQVNVEYAVKLTPEKIDAIVADIRAGKGPDAHIEVLPLMNGEDQAAWKGYEDPQPADETEA